MTARLLRLWPVLAALASLAMLGAAHAFQAFGYAPCALCLRQREVYWTALGVAVAGLVLARLKRMPPRLLALLLGLVFLVGFGLAAYHAGVEWKWWPGPTSCTGVGGAVTGDLSALLEGKRVRPPSCDEAAWRMAGLSMAGYNALISAALAGASLWIAAKGSRHEP